MTAVHHFIDIPIHNPYVTSNDLWRLSLEIHNQITDVQRDVLSLHDHVRYEVVRHHCRWE